MMNTCINCREISAACRKLKEQELIEMSKNCVDGEIKKGDTFLKQGAFASHAIYLREGLVKESMDGPGMKEQIFKILKSQSYLGMSSLFSNRVNHFSYTALSNLKVCYINKETLEHLMKRNGEFAYEIMVSMCMDNIKRSTKMFNQSQKKIYGRVADAIIYFSESIFENQSFKLPLTRKEIANLIGTSRESTTRALVRFHHEKIIELNGSLLKILNFNQLKNISRTG
jgi:CRP-like cAMP-binding protein